MLKDLLYMAFRTLCPMVFSRTNNRIQQAISSGQESGSYTAPANGIVKITGHCNQLEINNTSSGDAFSFTQGAVVYGCATVNVKKGDTINWQLSQQAGVNTYLYFYYSEFELP